MSRVKNNLLRLAPLCLVAFLAVGCDSQSANGTTAEVSVGQSLNPLRKLSGHSAHLWVNSLSWAPNGQFLVSGSSDGTARIWEVATGKTKATLSGMGGVNTVSWSPDGRYIATGSNEKGNPFRVWDTATWKTVFMINPVQNGRNDANVDSITWSPDSKRVAVALNGYTMDGSDVDSWVKVYDVSNSSNWPNTATLLTPLGGATSINWSPQEPSKIVFGTSADAAINSVIATWVLTGEPDGGTHITKSEIQKGLLTSLARSPDGKHFVTNYIGIPDDEIKIWDVASGKSIATYEGHTATVKSVSWSFDGKYVASGSWDMTVKVWDVASGQNTVTFEHPDVVNSVAWSPRNNLLASATADGNVWLWDVK